MSRLLHAHQLVPPQVQVLHVKKATEYKTKSKAEVKVLYNSHHRINFYVYFLYTLIILIFFVEIY